MTDIQGLRAAYDEQLRGASGFGEGTVDRDGPLVRFTGGHRGFVSAPADLPEAGLDDLIARTVAHFAAAGLAVEWKTRAHDRPVDLVDRLVAAGFTPEPVERVMIGESSQIAPPADVPGIRVRRTTAAADMARIADLHAAVWHEESAWLGADLCARLEIAGDAMAVFVAEDADVMVAAAWLVLEGRDFAGLWGGSTRAGHRGRGIYRRLVAERAALARTLGRRYLQVDASPDSAPILARLGLVEVTTTTPYVWHPPTS